MGSWPYLADGSPNLSTDPLPQVCVCVSVLLLYNSTDTTTPHKHRRNNLGLHKDETRRWRWDADEVSSSLSLRHPSPICLPWWPFSPWGGSLSLLFIGNRVLCCLSPGHSIQLSKWTFVDASGTEPSLWNNNYHQGRLSQFYRQSSLIKPCTWICEKNTCCSVFFWWHGD